MSAQHVFVLHHSYDLDDREETKLIGVYSSEAEARHAIARLSARPGFAEHPDDFHVDRYEVDRDHWTEGFVTLRIGDGGGPDSDHGRGGRR